MHMDEKEHKKSRLCLKFEHSTTAFTAIFRFCIKSYRLRLKRDGTLAETRFRLLAKRTSPFKPAGGSVQSTTGRRGVRISGSNAGYNMFRGSVKSTGYPLHSPVSPSIPPPCVTVCHQVSNALYLRSGQILVMTEEINCDFTAKFLIYILQSHDLAFTNICGKTFVLHWRLFLMNTNPLFKQSVATRYWLPTLFFCQATDCFYWKIHTFLGYPYRNFILRRNGLAIWFCPNSSVCPAAISYD
jgi:hypothetical protein